MPPTMHELGIDRLDIDARIALAQEIWESVELDVERCPLPEPQRRELERRLSDSLARPDAVTPWEVVKARALARASR